MAIGIYKITSPTKRIYVGSSINIAKRFSKYKSLHCKSQKKLYNSFLKYGVSNHTFEIITECEIKDLLRLETQFGEIYNVLNYKSGLNLQLPKEGDFYGGASKEKVSRKGFKTNMPAWNRGVPLTENTKKKLSESLKGRKVWNKGVAWSEEAKNKMSESSKGQTAWNKIIVLDTSNGIFYESIKEASCALNIKRTTLNAMLVGQTKNKTSIAYV